MSRNQQAVMALILLFCGLGGAENRSYAAQATPAPRATTLTFPVDPEKVRGICGDIYGNIRDKTNKAQWSFAFERKVYEAANVDFRVDSDDTARAKINTLWKNYQDYFTCDVGDFDVTNGNVLKYAVNIRAFGVVDTFVKIWGVDLNIIDKADGKTILDYIQEKYVENSGTALASVLAGYRDTLRNYYGAKYCKELQSDKLFAR